MSLPQTSDFCEPIFYDFEPAQVLDGLDVPVELLPDNFENTDFAKRSEEGEVTVEVRGDEKMHSAVTVPTQQYTARKCTDNGEILNQQKTIKSALCGAGQGASKSRSPDFGAANSRSPDLGSTKSRSTNFRPWLDSSNSNESREAGTISSSNIAQNQIERKIGYFDRTRSAFPVKPVTIIAITENERKYAPILPNRVLVPPVAPILEDKRKQIEIDKKEKKAQEQMAARAKKMAVAEEKRELKELESFLRELEKAERDREKEFQAKLKADRKRKREYLKTQPPAVSIGFNFSIFN